MKSIESNKNFAPRVQLTGEFKHLKEVADPLNQRVIDAEYYLTDLVETSLNEYRKGEWLGIVRNMWKNKIKNNGHDAEMR